MNSLTQLTAQQLRHAADIQDRIASLQKELNGLLGASTHTSGNGRVGKRKMSAAGRRRIAAAAKARWAKVQGKAAKPVKKKRKMSSAAKAKLSAAARERWKKAKAAGKKTL